MRPTSPALGPVTHGDGMSAGSAPAGAPASGSISTAFALRIVLFSAIGVAVNMTPLFLATFSVLLKPIEASLDQSRTAVMMGHAACLIGLAVAGPIAGRLVDRFGQGVVLMTGIPLLSLVLASFYLLPPSLPLFIAQCAMIGVVGSASYQFIYFSVVSLWFDRKLGVALAFAGVGTSIGFLIFTPLASYLVRTYDWQTTYLILGLISAAVAIPNMLLYRGRPVDPSVSSARGAPAVEGVSAREAFRTSAFWRLAISFYLMCVMLNGNLLHFVPMMTDRGLDAGTAAGIIGIAGVGVLAGRLGCGFLLLRFNGAYVGGLVFFLGVIGALLLIPARDPAVITAAILMLCLALGSEGELLNFMVHRAFGLRMQGTILGFLTAAYLFGTLSGPMMMSIWYDRTQSYDGGQWVLVGAGLVAALLILGVAKAVRSPGPLETDRAAAEGRG